jgi:hypothetical protein
MKPLHCLLGTVIFTLLSLGFAHAQTVLTGAEASKVIRFRNLNATPDKVSGEIVNASPHAVRDVQLLVQYHWLWNDERNPGQDSPGKTIRVDLHEELKPGESMPFSYMPSPPLPQRTDGRFMPEVDVGGFTVVVPQQRAART